MTPQARHATARLVLALALVAAGACTEPKRAPVAEPAAAPWRPCRLAGLAEPAECAAVTVWVDRARRVGPRLQIHVARLRATSRVPAPDPVIFLAGGPGQAATAVAAQVLPGLRRVRRERDLLFVDLRGTGRSGALRCLRDPKANDTLRDLFRPDFPGDQLSQCRAQLPADLRPYTTVNAVDDLEQLRRELGLGRVNVVGVSYGTRVALTWMRRHPNAVRAAVLDSVAPPQMILFADFARDAQAAWRALMEDCAAAPACARRFPALGGQLAALLAHVPPALHVRHPITAKPLTLRPTRAGVAMAVRGLLYNSELAALLPLTLAQARAGDWQPLVAQTLLLAGGAEDAMSLGLMLSTVCAEDVPRLQGVDLAAEVSGTFLGRASVASIEAMCARWPLLRPAQGDSQEEEPKQATLRHHNTAGVRSNVPTLLLSGAVDPVTPPRWAALAAKGLARSRQVVFPGLGHSVASHGCGPKLMAAFFAGADRPGQAAVDVRCDQETARPAFFLSPAGPAP